MSVQRFGVGHWEAVEAESAHWRRYCDLLVEQWLRRRLAGTRGARVLKTDLYEEAQGTGVAGVLAEHFRAVAAIDLASRMVRGARVRYPRLEAAQADVRRLPFADGSFDAVVSTSTLDHFENRRGIHAGLAEFHRALREGGLLLVTLDNAANPLVAVRNALPFGLLRRMGLVRYYVGATLGPGGLAEAIREAGFRVRSVEQIMHCPRVFCVPYMRKLRSAEAAERAAAKLLRLERLAQWPTARWTGHFTAVVAEKGAARAGNGANTDSSK